jgi:hypothetical protein
MRKRRGWVWLQSGRCIALDLMLVQYNRGVVNESWDKSGLGRKSGEAVAVLAVSAHGVWDGAPRLVDYARDAMGALCHHAVVRIPFDAGLVWVEGDITLDFEYAQYNRGGVRPSMSEYLEIRIDGKTFVGELAPFNRYVHRDLIRVRVPLKDWPFGSYPTPGQNLITCARKYVVRRWNDGK